MILMEDIIKEGHPNLTKKAMDVQLPLSSNDKKILKEMLEFVKNSQDEKLAEEYDLRGAVGIAAPQLNINKRMFVIHVHDFNNILHEHILINPTLTITDESVIYLPDGEGCLSIERPTEGLTPRAKAISIKAHRYDPYADIVVPVEINLDGYIGIVFQHEYDHLDGVLFIDKLHTELPEGKSVFEDLNPSV